MAGGTVALAGGLAALGLIPDADPVWTLAPQALIGAGIALAIPGLTSWALGGADPAGRRAAGTVAARHVGIVVGLVLLTPLFTSQLEAQGLAAQRSGTALILDAGLSPSTKIDLGEAIAAQIERSGGRLTEVGPAFRSVTPPPEGRAEYDRLQRDLAEEIDKAATHAFSFVFLVAGALALLAIVPIALGGGAPGPRRRRGVGVVAVAAVSSTGLVVAYLALGGASYEPVEVADPCRPRPDSRVTKTDALQAIALSALDGAACELRVTREELVLALGDEQSRAEFARRHRIGDASLERAVNEGLDRAIDEADRARTISGFEAGLLRRAAGALPVSGIIDALQSSAGESVIGFLTDLLRRG